MFIISPLEVAFAPWRASWNDWRQFSRISLRHLLIDILDLSNKGDPNVADVHVALPLTYSSGQLAVIAGFLKESRHCGLDYSALSSSLRIFVDVVQMDSDFEKLRVLIKLAEEYYRPFNQIFKLV
ncbi:hypothetical protein M413DRAFT_29360 [Hebeloma cylindrosporum]|uniref:Uncharacterized protein n=1 Tax=Hebeloma cylindrosporum TaxID=76867 RepID=A0A0C2XPZ8_HEBCY|nr:hypothetical protein M413DRAFT_29360 [Hebeloma cylindrosporum h7]